MTISSIDTWSVRVTKDTLVFSAAHFITFNRSICERIHGHNWRVEAEIQGPLDENHYVFDFIALRDGLQLLVQELDHRVLLPARHPMIQLEVSDDEREVTARFENRRWVFPREDCVILPIENTTAELIAQWIGHALIARLKLNHQHGLTRLRISVEENFGQWADCWLHLSAIHNVSGELCNSGTAGAI
ncbi:MAG: 6-pyruvoyl tetrahydropterin synthase family protein [Planctomycetales bacterium]|nr:6-pyruvoyl tetrahydropterin synthase family protein [Planctomycetales bacterium]